MPRGAEASAVRSAVARARSNARVVETGIGPAAAGRAADVALAGAALGTVVVTGLCGLLSSAFVVGDALVYREILRDGAEPLALESELAGTLAASLTHVQTGIRALASDRIVASPREKRALGERLHAHAVDMESAAIVERVQRRSGRVAVVRVASDAAGDALPDLERALDGAGGMNGAALARAMLRRPRAGARLAINGTLALRALRRSVEALLRA